MARAVLIARESADGLIGVNDDVEIGKVYEVDLSTIQTVTFYNVKQKVIHKREAIRAQEDDGWNFYPTELLRIES